MSAGPRPLAPGASGLRPTSRSIPSATAAPSGGSRCMSSWILVVLPSPGAILVVLRIIPPVTVSLFTMPFPRHALISVSTTSFVSAPSPSLRVHPWAFWTPRAPRSRGRDRHLESLILFRDLPCSRGRRRSSSTFGTRFAGHSHGLPYSTTNHSRLARVASQSSYECPVSPHLPHSSFRDSYFASVH